MNWLRLHFNTNELNFKKNAIFITSNQSQLNMNLLKIVVAICSLLFLMIGLDKFFNFMDPPCSLQDSIPPLVWKGLGAFQLASAFLLWMPKYRKLVAGFFCVFMIIFSIVHLTQNTYDIGGAAFMAILLGLLVWNPDFLHKKFFNR
jgi:hypothetical protein